MDNEELQIKVWGVKNTSLICILHVNKGCVFSLMKSTVKSREKDIS